MKYGLTLPTAGDDAGTEAIGRFAEGAERLGLDTVWSFERLLAPTVQVDPGGGQLITLPELYDNVYSPLEVLGYVAARTSRIRLGTSTMIALVHNPVDLARRFATLDQLSGGRIVAGLGQGWMRQEFEAAGVPRSRRGAGFAEFVEAMRAAWGPDPVSYDGKVYRFAESRVGPKPVQPGGPPVLVGAAAPTAIRRAAELGLGLNPIWFGWDALRATVSGFHEAARAAGHAPGELPIVLRINDSLSRTPQGTEPTVTGSPEQFAEALPMLTELGVTEVFWAMSLPADEQFDLVGKVLDAGH